MTALLLLTFVVAAAPLPPSDPGFLAITSRVGQQDHQTSVAQMQAWVDANPRSPDAGRALIWMAELRLADHALAEAMPLFARAAHDYPGTEWGHQGEKGVADLDVVFHRYAPAIAAYESLSRLPSPYWQYVGRMSAQSARWDRVRWWCFLSLVMALAISLAIRLGRSRTRLWPPPEEATYALPIVFLMLLAAFAQPPEEAHAVVTVALGGLALLYAHGAQLRARPQTIASRVLSAATGLCEAAALLYCAVIANDLWMKFAETVTSGAER